PKARETLNQLKKDHYIILTTFRKSKSNLMDQLDELNMAKLFDGLIIVSQGLSKHKYINNNEYFNKNNSIIIGDTEDDINAAKELNIPVFAVKSGLRSENFLRKTKPDHIINDISEVIKRI
ncbi:MAG: HAD hydrolase-like protein, partial [Nanoarchaeota archaeon]|nr:HAD hydrolase-like protein [Nanoarchaeota archaeon]